MRFENVDIYSTGRITGAKQMPTAIACDDCTLSLKNMKVANGLGYGLYLSDSFAEILENSKLTFTSMENVASILFASISGLKEVTETRRVTINYVEVTEGDIDGLAQWRNAGLPYRLDGTYRILNNGLTTYLDVSYLDVSYLDVSYLDVSYLDVSYLNVSTTFDQESELAVERDAYLLAPGSDESKINFEGSNTRPGAWGVPLNNNLCDLNLGEGNNIFNSPLAPIPLQ